MHHAEFDELTRSFIGLPLSRPWRGSGSALFTEIGPLSRTYPRSNHPKADRGLEFSWSWRVESVRSILFGSSSSDRRINSGIQRLEGLIIERIALCGRLPEIHVELSGGRSIRSFAASGTQPDWTVFLADGSWLTVRRGTIVRETNKQFANDRNA